MDNILPKIMPHNNEAEISVLGAVIVDKDSVTTVFEALKADDFYIEANKLIYASMLELFNIDSPIDLITLSEELKSKDALDAVGGLPYLTTLVTSIPTTANLKQHIDIILDKSRLRKLIKASNEVLDTCYSPVGNAQNASERAGQLIFNVLENQGHSGIVHIKDVLMQAQENIAEIWSNKGKLTGVPTGFSELDKALHGLQGSDLILIAARPAMGKTSFALNIAAHAAVHANIPVVIFSLEMSAVQLATRIMSSEMLIDSNKLRTGELDEEDWKRISYSMNSLSKAPVYINDSTAVTISDIRAKCRRLKLEKNLGLIVIDYLQLMQGSKPDNRQQEISEISRSLKILALELGIPIVTLSQLSRAPDQRTNHRPMLSDLRESGAIEQDADIVLFLYRDDIYNPDTEIKNIAECIIAKHRNGSTGTVSMYWTGEYTKFRDLDKQHE